MGKPDEHRLDIPSEAVAGGAGGRSSAGDVLRRCTKAFSPRCLALLALSAGLLLSAIFWIPPFQSSRRRFTPDDDGLRSEIWASFDLQKPTSFLAAHVERLEYDIFEEIGVPNTKVSIISIQSLNPTNVTQVVFGVVPDSKFSMISSPVLSILRSSLIEMELQQLNLSLTSSLFGHPSSFEVLKFPGGITVIPPQSASIWETTQILFNFTLNNSIFLIEKNLDELKGQLKFGLNLKSYENVYVQMTNINGSTVAPPVTVQASIFSDVGSHSLLPNRLKQLAQVIKGANNLGLDHSVFGKVKQVELSSYLKHSLECPSPSPSPSPSLSLSPSPVPAVKLPYFAPLPIYPTPSPSYVPGPSTDRHHQSPCIYCDMSPPSESPFPSVGNRPEAPVSPSVYPPGPSVTNSAPSPLYVPSISSSIPPNSGPMFHPYPPASPEPSPYPANSCQHSAPGTTPKMAPYFSPVSRGVIYGSGSLPDKGGVKDSLSPSHAPSKISPIHSYSFTPCAYTCWLLGFLEFMVLCLLCGP